MSTEGVSSFNELISQVHMTDQGLICRGVFMKKIAVIGAGITGITTAYQLMKKGYDVTVFDKQKYAAMETSYANGGQLSACNGEVWTNWKTIYQGIQWIFKKDAPLSINLKPSFHKIGWFLRFDKKLKNHPIL